MILLVSCVLLLAAGCHADEGVQTDLRAAAAAGSQPASPQPWLVGLTAVVVFLFIVFTLLIIQRLLGKDSDHKEGWEYKKDEEMDETRQTNL